MSFRPCAVEETGEALSRLQLVLRAGNAEAERRRRVAATNAPLTKGIQIARRDNDDHYNAIALLAYLKMCEPFINNPETFFESISQLDSKSYAAVIAFFAPFGKLQDIVKPFLHGKQFGSICLKYAKPDEEHALLFELCPPTVGGEAALSVLIECRIQTYIVNEAIRGDKEARAIWGEAMQTINTTLERLAVPMEVATGEESTFYYQIQTDEPDLEKIVASMPQKFLAVSKKQPKSRDGFRTLSFIVGSGVRVINITTNGDPGDPKLKESSVVTLPSTWTMGMGNIDIVIAPLVMFRRKDGDKNVFVFTYENALEFDAQNGDTESVRSFAGKKVDPKAIEGVLMNAIRDGDDYLVRILIDELNANVNARNSFTWTALMAATMKTIPIVKFLLEKKADVNTANCHGATALMLASMRGGGAEIVELLLDNNASVNAGDKAGMTSLMHASAYGNAEVVNALLNAGATVDTNDRDGKTALMHASAYGNAEVALIINAGDKAEMTALMHASAYGNAGVVNALLNAGATVDTKDRDGKTALMHASAYENAEVALMLASVRGGRAEIVELLLENNANVNAGDKDGKTALMHASAYGSAEVVKTLLENKADVNVATRKEGEGYDEGERVTALMLASMRGEGAEIVELLLKNDAYVNAGNGAGMTALMHASAYRNAEVVNALLNAKAMEVDTKDRDGKTALMFASEVGETTIVETLLKNGADVNEKDLLGFTALDIAEHAEQVEVVTILNGAPDQHPEPKRQRNY